MTNLLQFLLTRTAVYRLLQALYTYPLNVEKVKLLLELELEDNRPDEGLALLQSTLRDVADWETFVEQLNIEYTRLFEGPGFVPAPPYASFYLNDGLLMGQETVAVRRTYLEWKLAPIEMDRVPDDHIALEVAFMGYLCGEACSALAEGDDARLRDLLNAQARFLNDHLLTWIPRFCTEAASAAGIQFVKGLLRFTQAFLESDSMWLHDIAAA